MAASDGLRGTLPGSPSDDGDPVAPPAVAEVGATPAACLIQSPRPVALLVAGVAAIALSAGVPPLAAGFDGAPPGRPGATAWNAVTPDAGPDTDAVPRALPLATIGRRDGSST